MKYFLNFLFLYWCIFKFDVLTIILLFIIDTAVTFLQLIVKHFCPQELCSDTHKHKAYQNMFLTVITSILFDISSILFRFLPIHLCSKAFPACLQNLTAWEKLQHSPSPFTPHSHFHLRPPHLTAATAKDSLVILLHSVIWPHFSLFFEVFLLI